ncbi:SDR family NAD(P)-dependent oxidoreductase [Kitasatospora sp. NPDC002551]|uniref:SDR family NAD(P)-dependent oxidoreductase n=1 Tax=Kitasatospora sp. NPDC002551 TaxID=3154539 RepID=UPI0033299ED4
MAGFATAPGTGLYGASKFAVEGITEALHGELAPLGVRVTVVEPGGSAKAAKAIVDVIEAADPPLRLQLGADAVDQVEAELALVQGELDTWQHVSLSTAV